MTSKHRVWRFHEYGGSEVLRLEEIATPEPGDGEVLIKVTAGGLNRSDLLWASAGFFTPQLPAQIGAEICGIVERCGPGVVRFSPGDRVSNLPVFTRGAEHAYAHFAEYTVIPEAELIHTPPALTDAEGAAFVFTNLTQMCALNDLVHLKPGQWLLVTAGSSANGLSAIHLARHLGARVIATTRGPEKREMLLAAGAAAVVVTSEENLSERVSAVTQGTGVHVVYDCVGGALTNEIVDSLRPGATWIMYGFLDATPFTSTWPQWFARQPTLHIYALTQYTGIKEMGLAGKPEALQTAIEAVQFLCGEKMLPVPIAAQYEGIGMVQDAFRLMEENVGGGKIVVTF